MYCISPSFVLGFLIGLVAAPIFWENNPQRALSFATNAQKRSSIKNSFVISAG